MKWIDHESFIVIEPPQEFSYEECFVYLNRSDQEILHQIKGEQLNKLIKVENTTILLNISSQKNKLHVEFPLGTPSPSVREKAAAYIWELFDLDTDLASFYRAAAQDPILKPIANQYYGLRIIQIPDLFEALTWAIIGQQINLTFAYKLKRRFVEHYGEKVTYGDSVYWLHPTYDRIAQLEVDELGKLQFTTRKAEYVIGVAQALASGNLSRESLMSMKDPKLTHQTLVAIRGVGAWTADYVMMKCLHDPTAFPIADVGLHNALKQQLGLDRKPTIEEIKQFAINWEGWHAYATFYLWRSLL
jgi:DNA-3-methyladenine glycosylase II